MKEAGGPAFPTPPHVSQNTNTGETTAYQYISEGMTLRDWFAGMAMQAFISTYPEGRALNADIIAVDAYDYADAMLAEREKS